MSEMWRSRSGVAAIEFALIAGTLCFLALNLVDVARYIYSRMQVHNAAQIGAQPASHACDINHLPAATKCSGLSAAITAAIESTTLGSAVALQSGSPTEGYYCINSSGALEYVSSISAKPANCASAGMETLHPGLYLLVAVNYTYEPLFGDFTVARLFSTPISQTAWVRLL